MILTDTHKNDFKNSHKFYIYINVNALTEKVPVYTMYRLWSTLIVLE